MNLNLQNLRKAMADAKIDAYVIFNTDPNNDEYIPEEFMVVRHLTGFTGDNAIAIVTKTFAGLWTDSRFFISGEIELKGSDFKLMKKKSNNDPSYITFLRDKLTKGSVVAFDGQLITQSSYESLKQKMQEAGVEVRNNVDLTSSFWAYRPQSELSDIFILDNKYTGRSADDKIKDLLLTMKTDKNDFLVLNRLDDIAYLLNMRAADIDFCPLFRSFAIVDGKKKCVKLFIHKQRLSDQITKYLTDLKIEIYEYSEVYDKLALIPEKSTVSIDCNSANSLLVSSLPQGVVVQDRKSPVQFAKAIKNNVELTNLSKALIMDGVAMERFLYKMEVMLNNKEPLTELSLADILLQERKKGEGFISESFECISAFNEHAAMPHYAPNKESDLSVTRNGVYLVDSGGQYLYGTTDITRTIPTGRFPSQFAVDYTLVLQGNIELAMAVFPEGTSGSRIEPLARMAMWKHGRDFGHGTGHGVGYCLNCHEGPQAISPLHNNISLKVGMIVTNEPGIYIENEYGIRTENMMRVVKSDHNGFLKFEVMTLCHIDTRPVIKEMLTRDQIDFLNSYNQRVFCELSPYLDRREVEYLRMRTRKI